MAKQREWLSWDLATLSEHVKEKRVSPVEITEAVLQRIEEINPKLNAFITLLSESALAQAKQAEQEIIAGNWRGPLHGIPVGLKDLIDTAGVRTTMGSEIYQNYIPDEDAAVVQKLKEAGAVIIGKLNTHEFAYGPTGDVSYFGAVRNPYDLTRITGGSSSGSGASVASGMCFGALGSDTGGSVRIPSSACGIVGMKPTFGRVSKYGVYPLGYTLDHIGPMTRSIRDNALMLGILAGHDDRDPYSANRASEDFTRYLGQEIKGTVLGIPTSFYYDDVDDEVKKALHEAVRTFQDLGAEVREVDLDLSRISWAQLMTIRAEAYAVHEDHMESNPELLHPEVRERVAVSKETAGYQYVKAQLIRQDVVREFNRVFDQVEALITPTLAILPPEIGQREVKINGKPEHVYSALLRLNGPGNSTGLPCLSVPCGFSSSGLPIGMQLIGKHFDEANLYRLGYAFEQYQHIPTLKWEING